MAKQTTLIDYVSVIICLFEQFSQHRSSLMEPLVLLPALDSLVRHLMLMPFLTQVGQNYTNF